MAVSQVSAAEPPCGVLLHGRLRGPWYVYPLYCPPQTLVTLSKSALVDSFQVLELLLVWRVAVTFSVLRVERYLGRQEGVHPILCQASEASERGQGEHRLCHATTEALDEHSEAHRAPSRRVLPQVSCVIDWMIDGND